MTSDVIKRTSASSDIRRVYSLNLPIAERTFSASWKEGVSDSFVTSMPGEGKWLKK